MSFDLAIWNQRRAMTPAEAALCYGALCDGDDASEWIEPSERIGEFVGELTAFYPALDELMDDVIDECPWAGSFDIADDNIVVSIVWPRASEVSQFVVKLAWKYALTCYDPQKEHLHAPGALGGESASRIDGT